MNSRLDGYKKTNVSHIFCLPQISYNYNNTNNLQTNINEPKINNNNSNNNIIPLKKEKKIKPDENRKVNYSKFVNKSKEFHPNEKTGKGHMHYHNESDIFFINDLSKKEKQQLIKETYQPKTERYISNYNPEDYFKELTPFDRKMKELYPKKKIINKNDSFNALHQNPKAVNKTSRGYNEYIDKFQNVKEHNSPTEKSKNLKNGYKDINNYFYDKKKKFRPNASASDNYSNCFKSNIFNDEKKSRFNDSFDGKYIKPKELKKLNTSKNFGLNKSYCYGRKSSVLWPTDTDWTKDNDAAKKHNIKTARVNSNINAFDRNQIDSVKYLLSNKKLCRFNSSEIKHYQKNKTSLMDNDKNDRNLFDENELGVARAKKLNYNYSILEDGDKYVKNVDIGNEPFKNYEEKEYEIRNYGNADLFKLEKIFKENGVHLINIKDDKNFMKIDKDKKLKDKDKFIKIKVREKIGENNGKIKEVEKKLKKKYKYKDLEIKTSVNKNKNHRLKSAEPFVNRKYKKNEYDKRCWRY